MALEPVAERMIGFYANTDHWLRTYDRNHLRITRIIRSLRLLVSQDEAQTFHGVVLSLNEQAGSPVIPKSLSYWRAALE